MRIPCPVTLPNGEMDMNGDGTINTADFLIFVSHFPNASQFF